MTASITSKVRPATLRDAKSIAELHNHALQQGFVAHATQVALPPVPLERRHLLHSPEASALRLRVERSFGA